MINDYELRVGNWIQDEMGRPVRVESIFGDRFNLAFIAGELINDPLTEHEGIPLTPEILGKAGFEKRDAKTQTGQPYLEFWKPLNDDPEKWEYFKLENLSEGLFLHPYGYQDIRVGSVHQLQNLYFALTGEELNIEL